MRENIKPENWQTLASTVQECIGSRLHVSEIREYETGQPSQYTLGWTVMVLRQNIHGTYSAVHRNRCKSLAQTLVNYGLVPKDVLQDLLPD